MSWVLLSLEGKCVHSSALRPADKILKLRLFNRFLKSQRAPYHSAAGSRSSANPRAQHGVLPAVQELGIDGCQWRSQDGHPKGCKEATGRWAALDDVTVLICLQREMRLSQQLLREGFLRSALYPRLPWAIPQLHGFERLSCLSCQWVNKISHKLNGMTSEVSGKTEASFFKTKQKPLKPTFWKASW